MRRNGRFMLSYSPVNTNRSGSLSFCELFDNCLLNFVEQERIEIQKLRQGENLILGFSIGGGIDQDPAQNPFSQDKSDKVSLFVFIGLWYLVSIQEIFCIDFNWVTWSVHQNV